MLPVLAAIAFAQSPALDVLEQTELEILLPREGVAFAESFLVGFGAGHFYSGDPSTGASFAFLEGVAAGAALGVVAWRDADPAAFQDGGGPVFLAGAIGGLLGLRLIDAALAPVGARRAAWRRVEQTRRERAQ